MADEIIKNRTIIVRTIEKSAVEIAAGNTTGIANLLKDRKNLVDIANAKKEDHLDKIQQLRQELKDLPMDNYTDSQIFIWLQVSEFDLEKAKNIIRSATNFIQLLELGKDTKEAKRISKHIRKYEFITFLGFDKEDFPVVLFSIRNVDIMSYFQALTLFDICITRARLWEMLKKKHFEHQKKIGKQNEFEATFLIDLETFNTENTFQKSVIDYVFSMSQLFRETCPDVVHRTIIINEMSSTVGLYKVLLRTTSEKLFKNVHLGAKEIALEYIDENVLPAFLGGKRVDKNDDPFCSSFVRLGNTIPEELYVRNQLQLSTDDPDVQEIYLSENEVQDVPVDVNVSGSKMRIQFTSNGSINFRILFKAPKDIKSATKDTNSNLEDTDYESFSPLVLVHGDLSPINNVINCFKSGLYILRFDNDFPTSLPISVMYRIKLYLPGEEETL